MGDAAKQYSPRTELKSLLSLPRTKKSVFLTYVFIFSFILFTLFLAFNPNPANSYSSSTIWFKNIFNGITTTHQNVSNFSASTSAISSQIHVHNSTKSINTTTLEQEPVIVKTQNLTIEFDGKVGNFTQNLTVSEPLKVKNETQNEVLLHKVGILNMTTIEASQSQEVVKNQTQNKELVDKAVILKPNQKELNKNVSLAQELTGNGDKRIAEQGVVTNLTSSFSKKETKELLSKKSKTDNMMEELASSTTNN